MIKDFFCITLVLAQVSAKQLQGSQERDFFRWLRLPLTLFRTRVPIKTDASKNSNMDGRGFAEIAMVLPSDHLKALYDQGPEVFCPNMQLYVFHRCMFCLIFENGNPTNFFRADVNWRSGDG